MDSNHIPKQPCRVPWDQGCRGFFFGMGNLPPLINRNPYNGGPINPYHWVDEFIPYYMEIMGVETQAAT